MIQRVTTIKIKCEDLIIFLGNREITIKKKPLFEKAVRSVVVYRPLKFSNRIVYYYYFKVSLANVFIYYSCNYMKLY